MFWQNEIWPMLVWYTLLNKPAWSFLVMGFSCFSHTRLVLLVVGTISTFIPVWFSYSSLLLITWANLLAHHSKSKLCRIPKIEVSMVMYRVPPLWSSHLGERRTTCAKAYGINVSCYGEHVGDNIGNLGTYWEPDRTHWELNRNMCQVLWLFSGKFENQWFSDSDFYLKKLELMGFF